jgi:hypothetical protein
VTDSGAVPDRRDAALRHAQAQVAAGALRFADAPDVPGLPSERRGASDIFCSIIEKVEARAGAVTARDRFERARIGLVEAGEVRGLLRAMATQQSRRQSSMMHS